MIEGMMERWTWRRRWRYFWVCFRKWLLEDQYREGLGGPPNNWRSTGYIKTETYRDKDGTEYGGRYVVASFNNDAHEIWIGTKHVEHGRTDEQWKFYDSTKVFRKIALWYLWRWIWGEWFGLRRKLFYWDLHRRMTKSKALREVVLGGE